MISNNHLATGWNPYKCFSMLYSLFPLFGTIQHSLSSWLQAYTRSKPVNEPLSSAQQLLANSCGRNWPSFLGFEASSELKSSAPNGGIWYTSFKILNGSQWYIMVWWSLRCSEKVVKDWWFTTGTIRKNNTCMSTIPQMLNVWHIHLRLVSVLRVNVGINIWMFPKIVIFWGYPYFWKHLYTIRWVCSGNKSKRPWQLLEKRQNHWNHRLVHFSMVSRQVLE